MNDLSENFSAHEFRCRCSGCKETNPWIAPDLIDGLELLRIIVKHPLTILSGYRCVAHNEAIGGSPFSRHLTGEAADIALPPGFSPKALANAAEHVAIFRSGGIGTYPSWVHVDVRKTKPARWDETSIA